MNYMPKVLEMLGVEVGERFNIKGIECKNIFFDGQHHLVLKNIFMNEDTVLYSLLAGVYKIEKLPWKPKDGELFYYVSIIYEIDCANFDCESLFCIYCFNSGNFFKTVEEITDEIKQRVLYDLYEMKVKYENDL